MNKKAASTKEQEKIFIGVSWPYANGNIHIGHLAGQYVVCDIFARYHRLKGNEVLMVSGSDSHGAPVIFAAEEQDVKPRELADSAHETIVKTYKKLGFLYENYTSTRTENHKIVAQNVFLVLDALGFLTTMKTKQYYDPKVKRFLPDRYVRGSCPYCSAAHARGDECPECGEMLDPEDLIDPYSTLSDATPIIKETEHYYLDLSKVQGDLDAWLSDKTYWRKWVREFTLGWLREGLKPRSVTRDFSFGVPVPVKGWENKVLYVWIEAVVGYLSAAIEWAENTGDPSAWENFWKDPSCKHFYFIAGGNVPFHTIIWPAELIGYNKKYEDEKTRAEFKLPGETKKAPLNLPYDVPANNMLTYRGRKMSKGDKVGITLDTLLDNYNPDVIRYFFVRYAPEQTNREFIWKDFIDANNNELVGNLGNFINRVLTFTGTRFDGVIPKGELEPEVEKRIDEAFVRVGDLVEKAEFVKATEELLSFGKFANKYFNDKKPWETIKDDQSATAQTIYNAIQLVNALRLLFRPFLPFTAQTLSEILDIEDEYDPNEELEKSAKVGQRQDVWQFGHIASGAKIKKSKILFEKLEYSKEMEAEDNPEEDVHIIKAAQNWDFTDIDPLVVVGRVEEIDEKDGIQILSISTGKGEKRQIICKDKTLKKGALVPVALPGAKVVSLEGKPVKIQGKELRGITSSGMLCAPIELGAGENKTSILQLPDSFSSYLGTPLRSVRTIHFEKDAAVRNIPTAWTVLPNVEIKKNRSRKLDSWIKSVEDKVKAKYSDTTWKEEPKFRDFRTLHEKYGTEGIPGSGEDVINFILEKGKVPEINNVVDLYNTFSAFTGISIGAHDIEKISGTPRLTILKKDTPFQHATTGEKDTAEKGEYAYVDDRGILCRLDIKQGNRTNLTTESRHVLVLFQGNETLNEKYLKKQIAEFERLINSLVKK